MTLKSYAFIIILSKLWYFHNLIRWMPNGNVYSLYPGYKTRHYKVINFTGSYKKLRTTHVFNGTTKAKAFPLTYRISFQKIVLVTSILCGYSFCTKSHVPCPDVFWCFHGKCVKNNLCINVQMKWNITLLEKT